MMMMMMATAMAVTATLLSVKLFSRLFHDQSRISHKGMELVINGFMESGNRKDSCQRQKYKRIYIHLEVCVYRYRTIEIYVTLVTKEFYDHAIKHADCK